MEEQTTISFDDFLEILNAIENNPENPVNDEQAA